MENNKEESAKIRERLSRDLQQLNSSQEPRIQEEGDEFMGIAPEIEETPNLEQINLEQIQNQLESFLIDDRDEKQDLKVNNNDENQNKDNNHFFYNSTIQNQDTQLSQSELDGTPSGKQIVNDLIAAVKGDKNSHQSTNDIEEKGDDKHGIDSQFHSPNILGEKTTEENKSISSNSINFDRSQHVMDEIESISSKRTPEQTFNPNAYERMNDILTKDTSQQKEEKMEYKMMEPFDVDKYVDTIKQKNQVQNNELEFQSKSSKNKNWQQVMKEVSKVPLTQRNSETLQELRDQNNIQFNSSPYWNFSGNAKDLQPNWAEEAVVATALGNSDSSQHDYISIEDINKTNPSFQTVEVSDENKDNSEQNSPLNYSTTPSDQIEKIPSKKENNNLAFSSTPMAPEPKNSDNLKHKKKRPLVGIVQNVKKSKKAKSKKWKRNITIAAVVTLLVGTAIYGKQKNNNNVSEQNSKESTQSTNTQEINKETEERYIEQNQEAIHQAVEAAIQAQEEAAEKQVEEGIIRAKDQAVASLIQAQEQAEIQAQEEAEIQAKDQTTIKIGDSTQVNEGSRIYEDEYNAYLSENSSHAYYSHDENRVIVGVAILTENGSIKQICANNPNANQEISDYLNNGGELVSVLTANRKFLPNYDGSDILTVDEINAYAEGWYNINDIPNGNVKGMQR